MQANYAVVLKVLPEKHGVIVAYRDGSFGVKNSHRFVRVLALRAHPTGGADVCLPQPGELGLVLQIDPLNAIWLGSIHAQAENQVEGDPNIRYERHESGTLSQRRRNGDQQWNHPSGLSLRVVETGGDPDVPGSPLPLPRGEMPVEDKVTPAPWVVLEHPTMGSVTVNPDGEVILEHKAAGALKLDKNGAVTFDHATGGAFGISRDGDVSLKGFQSLNLGGDARFVMEAFVEFMRTHTHSGVTAGAGVSGPMVETVPAASLSPTTVKGPSA